MPTPSTVNDRLAADTPASTKSPLRYLRVLMGLVVAAGSVAAMPFLLPDFPYSWSTFYDAESAFPGLAIALAVAIGPWAYRGERWNWKSLALLFLCTYIGYSCLLPFTILMGVFNFLGIPAMIAMQATISWAILRTGWVRMGISVGILVVLLVACPVLYDGPLHDFVFDHEIKLAMLYLVVCSLHPHVSMLLAEQAPERHRSGK